MDSMLKKKKISQYSIIVSSILIYLVGVIAYSFWNYYEQKNEIIAQINSILKESAMSIDYLIPDGYHDRAIGPDSISKIEFFENTNILSKQADNFGVKYLYTIVLKDNKIFFTNSSATAEEMLSGENLTYYWQEYSEADTSFYHSFRRKIPTFSEYTDRWGTFKTIMIPRTTKFGNTYVICADMEISFIKEKLMSGIPLTLAKSLFLLIIVIPFIIVLFRNFKKYSSDLEEKVQQRTETIEEEILRRKKSEEILRQSEEKFSVAFNRMPVPMFIMDTSGIVIDINNSFEDVVGLKQNKVIGHFIISVPFFESASDFEFIKNYVQTNGSLLNHIMKYRKKTEIYSCMLSAELITINNKPHILTIVFDTSERLKYENELKFAKEKAEESDRLKSTFLANMSHEVRTPLNAVIGFSDLLRDENDPEVRNEYIDIITANSRYLLDLINDIIDISKIEAGQLRISESECNLNHLLSQVFQWIDKERAERGKSQVKILLTTALTDENSFVLADEGRLRQIFINLLTNALKFTNKGTIEFGYTSNEKELKFFVKDTGIGIQNNNLKSIFERFKQADEGAARKYGGTGLGLAISKAITELMGGSIWVESEYGKGSVFNFTLAFKSLSLEKIKKKTAQNKLSLQVDYTGRTFLLVEDDESSSFYLKTVLEKIGAKVINVRNGILAIEAIQNYPEIQLVLMDMHLPEMTGCMAAEEIHKIRPELPIIAQTADAMQENRERALSCGLNDFITKPIDRETLIEVITKYLKDKPV